MQRDQVNISIIPVTGKEKLMHRVQAQTFYETYNLGESPSYEKAVYHARQALALLSCLSNHVSFDV